MRDVFLLSMGICNCMQKPRIFVNFSLPAVAPRRAVTPWKAVKCSERIPNICIPLSRPSPVPEKSRQKSSKGVREGSDGSNSDPGFELRGKLLYLESIGVDSYQAVSENPSIPSAPIETLQTVVEFLKTMGLLKKDLGRVFGMCPEALTVSVAQELRTVFTFLLREVNVPAAGLQRVIRWRPRLLACSVKEQLRPTLYYLQRLGFTEVGKNSFLLSCSVEDKFIPRLDYFQTLGLTYRDTVSMVLRCPALFNYSIEGNFQPKFDYLVNHMGGSVDDLKAFPQYFAYSLEGRIKPRRRVLVENNVRLPLSVMLKASDREFYDRLDDFAIEYWGLDAESELWSSDPAACN